MTLSSDIPAIQKGVGPKLDKLSRKINSRNAPQIKNSKTGRFWFTFSDVLFKNLTTKSEIHSIITARTEKEITPVKHRMSVEDVTAKDEIA